MKIAILGTRGVPPTYGGFETFAAELGMRLVGRGHEVTVYCREPRLLGSGVAGLLGWRHTLSNSVTQQLSNPITQQPDHPATSPHIHFSVKSMSLWRNFV